MNWRSEPSFALPILMPCFHPTLRKAAPPPSNAMLGPPMARPDSESDTISVSSFRIVMPLGRPKCFHESR